VHRKEAFGAKKEGVWGKRRKLTCPGWKKKLEGKRKESWPLDLSGGGSPLFQEVIEIVKEISSLSEEKEG